MVGVAGLGVAVLGVAVLGVVVLGVAVLGVPALPVRRPPAMRVAARAVVVAQRVCDCMFLSRVCGCVCAWCVLCLRGCGSQLLCCYVLLWCVSRL